MKERLHKIRIAAIILLAAGYGWAGGHYIPADSNFLAYVFQFAVISIIIWLGINYNRYAKGLTIFSVITLIINILNIVHGTFSSGKNSFGSHNTFADLVPIILIIGGSVLWLLTTIFKNTINSELRPSEKIEDIPGLTK
jgi:hypothetical protein